MIYTSTTDPKTLRVIRVRLWIDPTHVIMEDGKACDCPGSQILIPIAQWPAIRKAIDANVRECEAALAKASKFKKAKKNNAK